MRLYRNGNGQELLIALDRLVTATKQEAQQSPSDRAMRRVCQLKPCQLPRNSAETTCTTTPEQIETMS